MVEHAKRERRRLATRTPGRRGAPRGRANDLPRVVAPNAPLVAFGAQRAPQAHAVDLRGADPQLARHLGSGEPVRGRGYLLGQWVFRHGVDDSRSVGTGVQYGAAYESPYGQAYGAMTEGVWVAKVGLRETLDIRSGQCNSPQMVGYPPGKRPRRPGIVRTPRGPVEPLDPEKRTYTTFTELGGRPVDLDEVRNRLGELQLDLVLGVLSRLSAHHVRDGSAFMHPQQQGPYLMSIKNYLLVAGLMLAHAHHIVPQFSQTLSPWTNIDSLVSSLRGAKEEVRRVMELFLQSPEDLRSARRTSANDDDLFDFEDFQRRPFIEARPNEMLWPVFSLFLRQLLSYPLQVLHELEGGSRAVGRAYEDYAHSLVGRIGKGDVAGKWEVAAGVKVKVKKERSTMTVGEIDSLLWRDGVAIVLEHKGGNLVLSLGDRDAIRNALGPTDRELALLPSLPEKDTGAITHGLWQLARIAPAASDFFGTRFGRRPVRVLPLITTLEAFEIEEWIREGYLEPLLARANLSLPANWSRADWITVFGLEALAQLADDGRLNLIDLLDGRERFLGRFTAYLAERFGGMPLDGTLVPVADQLMREANLRYFGDG
jgi:hypothetical protein